MVQRRAATQLSLMVILGLGLVSGCHSNPTSFARASAKKSCKRLQTCNSPFYAEQYSRDLDRCVDAVERDRLETDESLEEAGCEFMPEEARACLDAMRENANRCLAHHDEEIAAACDAVFACPDPG